MRLSLSLLIVLLGSVTAIAQEPIGIFDNHVDVGEPAIPGFADYKSDSDIYSVDAVGETIGDESYTDQFHFVYKEMNGSFAIEGAPIPAGIGQGGLMIRHNLDADAAHVSILLGDDFTVHPRFRTIQGGGTVFDGETDPGGLTADHTGRIRLEKLGNSIYLYTFNEAGEKVLLQSEVVPFENTVFAGLAATANTGTDFGLFDFEEVSIEELPLNVYRTLPTEEFEAGASLTGIQVTASVREGQTADTTVHEVVPPGATISNVNVSTGSVTTNEDGSIDWTLTGLSGEAVLTYDIQLGNGASAVWQGTFNDGSNAESFIGADTILPKSPQIEPRESFEVDRFLPTVMQAEWATPIGDNDFGLMVDPHTRSGITLISMDEYSNDTLLEFVLNIPEDGTYYFFGNVRAEDGTSDSFHVEVDAPPIGDDSSRWGVSSRKQFSIEWTSSEDPSLDPRPFELSVGEHALYIGNREDGTSIDWIAITNDPNLDLSTYSQDLHGMITRTIPNNLLDPGETKAAVELSAYIQAGITEAVNVLEVLPAGFSVEDLNASDGNATVNSDGSISWNLSGVTGTEATLSYTAVAPSPDPNIFTFEGTMTIGSDTPIQTSGDAVLGIRKEPSGKTVYLIRRISANITAEVLMSFYLQAVFGATVQEFDDTNAPGYEMPGDLTGADFLIVAESVSSGNVGNMNYHVDSEIPIFTPEAYLYDDFLNQPGEGFGTADDTEIEIVDNSHPITEGFDLGVITAFEEEMWMGHMDDPPAGVKVLATAPGAPNRARLWVVEAGETVNGQTVPGLRIGAFLQNTGFAVLTSQGRQLMAQAFAYALNEEPPVSVNDYMIY